jgi:Holliday junction resolvasome RuvABC endonuclease subunit
MKLLSLDQSSRVTGYAFFDNGKLMQSGTISLSDDDIGNRLVQLRDTINQFITEWEIDYVIYEDIQLQDKIKNVGAADGVNNVATFKILAEVIGVLEELFAELNIAHSAVLATQWKSAVGIKGKYRAEQKQNAQAYVQKHYGLAVSEDESDAICIGSYYITKTDVLDWSD